MAAARVLGLTVSLCHGPGCRREQTVPFWCSEECQERWRGQYEPSPLAELGVPFAEVCRNATALRPALMASVGAFSAGNAVFELEQQNNRLRAAFWPPERAEEAIAEAARRTYASLLTYRQVVDAILDDEARKFASANAAYPQVAPEEPQVARGWLGRWLGRMFGKDHT